jgi:hypothetical protein
MLPTTSNRLCEGCDDLEFLKEKHFLQENKEIYTSGLSISQGSSTWEGRKGGGAVCVQHVQLAA